MYPQNLLQVDDLIESFIKKNERGIATIYKSYYYNDNKLEIKSLLLQLMDELRTGCVTYINKKYPIDEIDSYIFYIVNAYCKNMAQPIIKKNREYLCPGCLYLNKNSLSTLNGKVLNCNECEANIKLDSDPIKNLLFRTFYKHNRSGYHCTICDRFIPHPIDNSTEVSCPYFDCWFVGRVDALKKMHHPIYYNNSEKSILDVYKNTETSFKNNIAASGNSVLSKLEIKQNLIFKYNIIKNVIISQSASVPYSSSDFTIKHKFLAYQAINNLLDNHPEEMIDYLLNESRSGGFQHRIFQEYIKLLEESLPFIFRKGGKNYIVRSLLDDNLSLFDGISEFDAIVTDKLFVKNNTKEFYIGGRKASYTKPYYIGKIINIFAKKSNTQLLSNIVEYSFNKIKMKDIIPGIEVHVTHLRVPPHYQMGGMVYINRIRRKIIDRVKFILNKGVDD